MGETKAKLDKPEAESAERELMQALAVLARFLARPAPKEATQEAGTEPWLSIADGAKHAAVSEGTVREWIRRGLLPAGHCGNVLRVRRSDIDALLLSGKAEDRSAEKAEPGPEEAGVRKSPRALAILASLADDRGGA